MACGDADELIQWRDTDISIVVILVKKYRNLLVTVVLLLITSYCKAEKAPICHSETFNSLWTGNELKNLYLIAQTIASQYQIRQSFTDLYT